MKGWKYVVDNSDIVVEVVDARFPWETRNRSVEEYVKNQGKPLIIAINKCDLVPKEFCEKVKNQFEYPAVFVSARRRYGTRILRKTILALAKKFPVIVGIVGYPNVGKSSLINVLKGKSVAGVSPKAGFTRGPQIVKISRKIYLLDSPGIIPLKADPEELCFLGAYDVHKVGCPERVAIRVFERLERMYGIKIDPMLALENLAKRWGKLLEGGKPDIVTAAKILVEKWQRGDLSFLKDLLEA